MFHNKLRQKVATTALLLCCCSCFAYEKLPVPSELIDLSSPKGASLFDSSYHTAYWKLSPYFVTQKTLAYCGVASAVMVLNAGSATPPLSPAYTPYQYFDQDNFFTEKTLSIITPAKINAHGITLEQLSQTLNGFSLNTSIHYGTATTEKQFREDVIKSTESKSNFMIVNFHRKYIYEVGYGHFSPIAAYDESSDRVLLLDVARYKYPPVWVKLPDLLKAITLNSDGQAEKNRGYITIST